MTSDLYLSDSWVSFSIGSELGRGSCENYILTPKTLILAVCIAGWKQRLMRVSGMYKKEDKQEIKLANISHL